MSKLKQHWTPNRQGTLKKGKPPDFHLWAVNPDTQESGTVGAAWLNDDGAMTIKINPFVTLTATMTVKLYPADPNKPPHPLVQVSMDDAAVVPPEVPTNERGEIPF